jgi:hypothetical protein
VSEPVVDRATVDEEDVGPPVLDEGFDDDEQCDADLEASGLLTPNGIDRLNLVYRIVAYHPCQIVSASA